MTASRAICSLGPIVDPPTVPVARIARENHLIRPWKQAQSFWRALAWRRCWELLGSDQAAEPFLGGWEVFSTNLERSTEPPAKAESGWGSLVCLLPLMDETGHSVSIDQTAAPGRLRRAWVVALANDSSGAGVSMGSKRTLRSEPLALTCATKCQGLSFWGPSQKSGNNGPHSGKNSPKFPIFLRILRRRTVFGRQGS